MKKIIVRVQASLGILISHFLFSLFLIPHFLFHHIRFSVGCKPQQSASEEVGSFSKKKKNVTLENEKAK